MCASLQRVEVHIYNPSFSTVSRKRSNDILSIRAAYQVEPVVMHVQACNCVTKDIVYLHDILTSGLAKCSPTSLRGCSYAGSVGTCMHVRNGIVVDGACGPQKVEQVARSDDGGHIFIGKINRKSRSSPGR